MEVNNKINESLMTCEQDVTILGHLKNILSESHYDKIKSYLKTEEANIDKQ
jgi:hypothetical protein